MLSCLKLPLTFDVEGLEADLNLIASDEWVRHFNDRYYEGEWSGVALRAVDGASNTIYPDPTKAESYADTPLLSRCGSIQRALGKLECPVRSARLLKLGAGARIIEHRDHSLSLEDGEIRLHVPITTSPLVDFYLNGERIEMKSGECWYINANLPHKVNNRSDTARVHLVIDCKVNDWLLAVVASTSKSLNNQASQIEPATARPSAPEALNAFCDVVFGDTDLRERLTSVADQGLFIDMVVRLGAERGLSFNSEDVAGKLYENRRIWFEKWV
ncbi:MAG TPA: aspartyl/asparaginyl beta-hydroxylase domain-containing protein [Blastocatellia bacterium]|nr:aspartyl/asparaginyl beta-hydroxylase domain-containing protein [Blastocatellia bacterium]